MRMKQGMYKYGNKTAKVTNQKIRMHQSTTGKPSSTSGLSKSKGIGGGSKVRARGSY